MTQARLTMVRSLVSYAALFAVSLMAVGGTPAANAQPASHPRGCNEDASAVSVAPVQLPSAKRLQGSVTVLVELVISSVGTVTDAKIFKSSGDGALDNAALKAARATAYTPKTVHCVATEGRYVFRADFNGVQPLSPTISIPAGWQPGRFNDNPKFHTLSWSDVPAHQLILQWQTDARTIDQVRASELNAAGGLRADEAIDVTLCNGTQSGVRFIHHKREQQPEGVVEVVMANGMMYSAAYLGYDGAKPGQSVLTALDSFCVPIPPKAT